MAFEIDDKPIFSSRADDLEQRDAIDQFVVGLAERVDLLQDADSAGRLADLGELARALVVDAARNGFDPLSLCSEAVAQAAAAGQRAEAHRRLVELSHLAQRVRRGHRGAL